MYNHNMKTEHELLCIRQNLRAQLFKIRQYKVINLKFYNSIRLQIIVCNVLLKKVIQTRRRAI